MAGFDDPMDPILQREMNLVKYLLANSASVDVPLTPYFNEGTKEL